MNRISQDVMASQTYHAFPELKQYSQQLHFIDATINRREIFITRDTVEIVNEITQAYGRGKTKFLFYMFNEAVLSHIVFKIHRIVKLLQYVIPSENFFYLSGAINGEEAYERLVQRYNFFFRINVLSAAMFHHYLKSSLNKYDLDFNTFEVKIKPKKFLCFNKVERQQRLLLLERMLENKYVDLGYYSFESTNSGNFSAIADMLSPDIFPNIRANKHMFPLRLNINQNRTNPTNIISDDLQYFKNSYFSIVNETIYYGYSSSNARNLLHQLNAEYSSIFISEKTFKCLAIKHPFVLFARPGMIKGLHQLGFKTFSPYFDESYDSIEDDDKRFDAIFNEITRLIKLSDDEWLNILKNIEPILEHNHTLFFNKNIYGVSTDVQKYFQQPRKTFQWIK
jgi:hypothetical protein